MSQQNGRFLFDYGSFSRSHIPIPKFRDGQRVKCFYGEGIITKTYYSPMENEWRYSVVIDQDASIKSRGGVAQYGNLNDEHLSAP